MARRLATATIYTLNLAVSLVIGVVAVRAAQLAALDVCVLAPLVILFWVLRHQPDRSGVGQALVVAPATGPDSPHRVFHRSND